MTTRPTVRWRQLCAVTRAALEQQPTFRHAPDLWRDAIDQRLMDLGFARPPAFALWRAIEAVSEAWDRTRPPPARTHEEWEPPIPHLQTCADLAPVIRRAVGPALQALMASSQMPNAGPASTAFANSMRDYTGHPAAIAAAWAAWAVEQTPATEALNAARSSMPLAASTRNRCAHCREPLGDASVARRCPECRDLVCSTCVARDARWPT